MKPALETVPGERPRTTNAPISASTTGSANTRRSVAGEEKIQPLRTTALPVRGTAIAVSAIAVHDNASALGMVPRHDHGAGERLAPDIVPSALPRRRPLRRALRREHRLEERQTRRVD